MSTKQRGVPFAAFTVKRMPWTALRWLAVAIGDPLFELAAHGRIDKTANNVDKQTLN